MSFARAGFCLAVLVLAPVAAVGEDISTNPLAKVIELLDGLAAKVTADGEAEAKAYHEYAEWCDEASHNAQYAIETATSEKAKLEAKIGELAAEIETSDARIAELAAAIAKGEAELKAATAIRDKEAADFAASDAELIETVDTLGRAIGILEKEIAKNPAALAQVDTLGRAIGILEKEIAKNPAALAQVDTRSAEGVMRALSVVMDAAALPGSDQRRLQALLQTQADADSDADDAGAPAAAVYKSQSGGIVDVLEDLKEKADEQLSELRKAEVNAKHNFELLKQSLEDQSAADTKDLEATKATKAAAEEGKATAEGDLEKTTAFLVASQKELETTHASCLTVAADHEASVASRAEELKAIAEAKKILAETSGGAVAQAYSFVQVGAGARLQTRADLKRSEVVTMVRHLAKRYHSAALAQLASRITAVAKFGAASGEDPFAKIKGLIQELIAKLEKEADADATEKAYCDHETSKTEAKKAELDEEIAKLTAKIDQAAATSAELKEQVKVLGDELAALAKEQAEIDKIRQEQHQDYLVAKADLELGLSGVRKALGVLRDYYAAKSAGAGLLQDDAKFGAFMQQPAVPEKHGKQEGAGTSIIGILEVVESDFATNLAKVETEEADQQSEYDKVTQENALTKAAKDQDVAYKTAESKSLDKTISELSADREGSGAELAAVSEYYAKLNERCVAKPETYEERKARREAEIEGLKSALSTLESETAFVQRRHRGRHMRGAAAAAAAALAAE